MRQRNKVRRAFSTLNRGNPSNSQHITFFSTAALDQLEGGALHGDKASSDCNPVCLRFAAHINHVGLAAFIKMIHCGKSFIFQYRGIRL